MSEGEFFNAIAGVDADIAFADIFRKYNINSRARIIVDRSLTGINRFAFDEYIGYRALINKVDLFNYDNLKFTV